MASEGTYIGKTRETKRDYKVAKKMMKSLRTKQPLNKSEAGLYNALKRDVSDYRESRRHESSKSGGFNARKKVTRDNRPEVAKGSKASGVSVNDKPVRRGKVKAAENMVRKSKMKSAAKTSGKAGLVGVAAQSAAVGFEAGRAIRRQVDKQNTNKTANIGLGRATVRKMQQKKKR